MKRQDSPIEQDRESRNRPSAYGNMTHDKGKLLKSNQWENGLLK